MITSKMVAVYLREYSIIGVSPVLLSMYKTQNFFLVLLKFDFLCSVSCCQTSPMMCNVYVFDCVVAQISFAIFNIASPKKHSTFQFTALSVLVFVSIVHWIVGWLAVVKEIKNCLFLFICISMGTLLWIPLQVCPLLCLFDSIWPLALTTYAHAHLLAPISIEMLR